MGYVTTFDLALQQAIPNTCTAKTLGPSQRLNLGVQGRAGHQAITDLADDFDVSRKFVYQQVHKAQAALDDAFAPTPADDQVLFHLPVRKAWLRQLVLGLLLLCHSSYRGVIALLRDLLNVEVSLGTIHNIVRDAVDKARHLNAQADLSGIAVAGLDEIFQAGRPVLVGADCHSTYCFLLTQEDHRDADTWAVRLMDLGPQGFDPHATIADFGTGLRAGVALALPGKPCRGDVFHALREVTALSRYLDNRAYQAIAAHDKLDHKHAKTRRQGRSTRSLGRQRVLVQQAQTKAIALADDVAVLADWLHHDVFAVSGLDYAERCALYDGILAELQARQGLCPHRLGPVCTLLKNHRHELLAFAAELDTQWQRLATAFEVPVSVVRDLPAGRQGVLDGQALDPRQAAYWQTEAVLRRQLGSRWVALSEAVRSVAEQTVRSRSRIENLNSRLRNYFFLRRQLGNDYLALLQFFLNHHRFDRSERADRVGKSPAELLTGEEHPHWLELLGYTRFSRN